MFWEQQNFWEMLPNAPPPVATGLLCCPNFALRGRRRSVTRDPRHIELLSLFAPACPHCCYSIGSSEALHGAIALIPTRSVTTSALNAAFFSGCFRLTYGDLRRNNVRRRKFARMRKSFSAQLVQPRRVSQSLEFLKRLLQRLVLRCLAAPALFVIAS